MTTTLKPLNPTTNEYGPDFPVATVDDAEAAMRAAASAFGSCELADPARRARAMRGTASRLRARGDEIVACAGIETALPDGRLRGELERTCVQLELHADACEAGEHLDAIIDHADPDASPAPRPDLRRMSVAIGPVVVFGASNFPLAFSTAGGDTASALAAGCPVVVKGHRLHPGTSSMVADEVHAAVADAGLPAGTFAHLLAVGHDVADTLVDHPATAAVAFTGSEGGGRALMDRAAARSQPIPVFAEMGSLNPVVITAGALAARREELADALTASVCTFGGQLCTKPGIVLVPDDAFGEQLVQRFEGRGREVLLGRAIAESFADGTGAELVEGTRVQPIVLSCTAEELVRDARLREEHFGPAVVVATFSSDDELAVALASLSGNLTATLHAEPDEHPRLTSLIAQLVGLAGRVLFDGVPTGVSVSWATQHGGPYPAASSSAHTSVGLTATRRFLRPVTFQSAPPSVLPPALRDDNPLGLMRRVDGVLTRS